MNDNQHNNTHYNIIEGQGHFAECCYAECHYVKCCYSECHGTSCLALKYQTRVCVTDNEKTLQLTRPRC